MTLRSFSNTIGFDDAPVVPGQASRVKVVGAVYSRLRLDGVLIGEVGLNTAGTAEELAALVIASKFSQHAQLVLLQGIALGGFSVVDVHELQDRLATAVLVVSRKQPDLPAIERALTTRIPDGRRLWRIIEKLGPMEPLRGIFVQRVGLTREEASAVVERLAVHSRIPEPVRAAHLIAGALSAGQSRGQP